MYGIISAIASFLLTDAVQFIIKTEAVEIKKIETEAPVAKKRLTFWEKVLQLFGLD